MKPTRADRAYAAGFLDGEGSIVISVTAGQYVLYVTAEQKVPAPLSWLAERWGGFVRVHHLSSNPMFGWRLSARAALCFLVDVRPYLKVKGDQADIAIAFQRGKGRGGQRRADKRAAILSRGAAAKARLQVVRLADLAVAPAAAAGGR